MVRNDRVTPALDPQPYVPRKNTKKTARMLKEFSERVGDPNTGGVTRTKIMTAYRQDALRLLHALFQNPRPAPKALRETTGIELAAAILQDNHYGWFERVSRGIYDLSPKGTRSDWSLCRYHSHAGRQPLTVAPGNAEIRFIICF